MSLAIGLIGLPNAGKSTLFNALVGSPQARVEKYPFTTIDKNIGVVEVSDEILLALARMENMAKVTPVSITFVDIAGLIKGAAQGEGLGNQFLHHIREVDLILHVVRFFKNPDIPHVHSQIDPKDDIEIVNDELLLKDWEIVENRLNREKVSSEEKEVLKKLQEKLNQGIKASDIELSDTEREIVVALNLLTAKKQIMVANIDEADLKNPPSFINNQPIISVCAKWEQELSELPWTEQQKFLKEYGVSKTAKEEVIQTCYQYLDLVTFYTIAKRQEARAWPIKSSSTALEAAGKIHTDFAKNFIKAEVVNALELLKIGSWHKAAEEGKIALHGRDYIVQDQDVMEFKVGI